MLQFSTKNSLCLIKIAIMPKILPFMLIKIVLYSTVIELNYVRRGQKMAKKRRHSVRGAASCTTAFMGGIGTSETALSSLLLPVCSLHAHDV